MYPANAVMPASSIPVVFSPNRSGSLVRIGLLCASAFGLLWPIPAWAIPSLTPHTHSNPNIVDRDTTWIRDITTEQIADDDPDNPNAMMHQHRDRDPLPGPNGKYIGNKCWDNRSYRTGVVDYGHCFISQPPRYQYGAGFPAAGKTDFDNGVVEWETVVNGNEVNTNAVPIIISIDYLRMDIGAHEIDVLWADITPTAQWDPAATDFTFDSNPSVSVSAPPGSIGVRNVGVGPCAPTLPVPSAWHYGGAGVPPNITRNLEICNPDGTFTAATSTFPAYDFYTIALHEQGHSWALAHFGVGIMRADISSFVMRDPDAGSIDGVKDHYSIPTPEPATLLLSGIAFLLMRRSGR